MCFPKITRSSQHLLQHWTGHITLSFRSTETEKLAVRKKRPDERNLWYGLFKTLIYGQPFSLAAKMANLQTLTIGRPWFGKPATVLNKFLHLLQNFRESSTQQRNTISELLTFINNLVEIIQSLGFHNDLKLTLFVQFAVNKLSPQPNLIYFNIYENLHSLAIAPRTACQQPPQREFKLHPTTISTKQIKSTALSFGQNWSSHSPLLHLQESKPATETINGVRQQTLSELHKIPLEKWF